VAASRRGKGEKEVSIGKTRSDVPPVRSKTGSILQSRKKSTKEIDIK